jgi:hypothetical protein
MLLYASAEISAAKTSFTIDLLPSQDISNAECWLKVEQMYTSEKINLDVVRCSLTQPMSQEFIETNAIGNSSVIYLHNYLDSPGVGPDVLVYVPDGPQRVTISFSPSTPLTKATNVGMIISLHKA